MNSTLFRKRPQLELARRLAEVLAGAGLFAALALYLAHWFAPFDLLRQGWPALLAGLAGLALLSAGLRAWAASAAATLAVLAALPVLLGDRVPSPRPELAGQAPSVVFVTHNLFGRWVTAQDALTVLDALDADVLGVQEANGSARPIDQALRARFPYRAQCDQRGSRLYSRLPVRNSGCVYWRAEPVVLASGESVRWNPPATAWAEIETPDGGTAHVLAVHMTWPEPFDDQRSQRLALADFIAELDASRLVILGDLNAAAPSVALRRTVETWGLSERTGGLATWPAPLPFMGIDHVLAGSDWTTVSVERGPATGSDHYPVRVELALTGSASFPE